MADEEDLLASIFGAPTAETKVLNDFRPHPASMKLGRLRQFLAAHADLPDDTPVLIERIEDVYFEKYGWVTLDLQYPDMAGPQKFFEPHGPCVTKGMVLIHGHY